MSFAGHSLFIGDVKGACIFAILAKLHDRHGTNVMVSFLDSPQGKDRSNRSI
jgi:hypothetical protein